MVKFRWIGKIERIWCNKMKVVTVNVTTLLQIQVEDGVDPEYVLEEMNYEFTSNTQGARMVDTEITAWEILPEA
jgi:hypothetical protein